MVADTGDKARLRKRQVEVEGWLPLMGSILVMKKWRRGMALQRYGHTKTGKWR